MTQSPPDVRDALAPIELAVSLVSTLVVAALLLVTPFVMFGSGRSSMLGFGEPHACVVVDRGVLHLPSGDVRVPKDIVGVELSADASVSTDQAEVCADDPAVWQRAVAAAPDWAGAVLLLGSLLLTRRALRGARRVGLFTAAAARRTRTLGRFVLIGSLLTSLIDAISQGVVVDSVTDGVAWTDPLTMIELTLPWTLLLAAAGILTFARILERAVPLQDDADATI